MFGKLRHSIERIHTLYKNCMNRLDIKSEHSSEEEEEEEEKRKGKKEEE